MNEAAHAVKERILSYLSPAEKQGLANLEKQVVNQYVHLGEPITKRNFTRNPSPDEVTAALAGKNLTVLCGGGKDSLFVLAGARALQLSLLEKYGVTFELRVCVGRHPGMLDVYGNLDRAFEALELKNDPSVSLVFIDGKQVVPYGTDVPLPEEVIRLNRDNVLTNGHIFSGAGRRTFCDDCNKNLVGWIATALSYNGGADLYMTGDSRKELRVQIGHDVPKLAEDLGVSLPQQAQGETPVRHALQLTDTVVREHTRLTHGDEAQVELRAIDWQQVPQRTSFVSFFSQLSYDSTDRLPLLTEFLGFDPDSLMFSFTETDCGNPALMCHLYGLIAEHAYRREGASYGDGVRMYVDYAVGKMREKHFPEPWIEKMQARYEDDAAIDEMREKVETYAQRAYGLTPDQLVAMVYAPFTQDCHNLSAYLDELVRSKNPYGHQLHSCEQAIRRMLASSTELDALEKPLAAQLETVTGLSVKQMRHLTQKHLICNNLDANWQTNDPLRAMAENDTLYQGLQTLHIRKTGETVQIQVQGR